ncbi:MAG: hypothetical protein ACK4PR_05420 [Gammaproteobacteria bacterium]
MESQSPNIILPKNPKKKYSILICGSLCRLTLFEFACYFGKITHLQAFGYDNQQEKKVVKADNYSVIRFAAESGQTDTIRYLETNLTTDEKKQAVKADDYGAFYRAALNGALGTIRHLETHLTPKEKKQAVMVEEYSVIRER